MPAFPPTGNQDDFDGRYTSTPCVLRAAEGLLMYYSARDWKNTYTRPDGTQGRDNAGVYGHIGLAILRPDKRPE